MEKLWEIKATDPESCDGLIGALKVHPIIAQLLVNRGIVDAQEAQQFLSADINSLHDPFLFKGMRAAVDRIDQARDLKQKVLVFGDYDVDGVTSSAILTKLLIKIGVTVVNWIPHRMTEGYGLNHEIAQTAKDQGVSLLIAVDCGTTAVEEINTLNAVGIDVIIIDHHMPDGQLPNALALINPKQEGCAYPFKDLASVGLTTKLAHAVLGELPQGVLDLTAMGTIADIVPLRGENRVFVKLGLPRIEQTKNKGLAALLEVAKIKGKKIQPYHIGFILGPRINASGRMDSAHKSLDLFLAMDEAKAFEIALELDQCNQDRQKMQREVVDEAMIIVEQAILNDDQQVLVVSKEGWHKGVLGIVASRICDKYYRPAVVISVNEQGIGTASARSIDGFHLHEALTSCASCLEAFGGHSGAAGLTIKNENIGEFRSLINTFAKTALTGESLKPKLSIDTQVLLSALDLNLVNIIEDMQPFGEANPQPILCTRNLRVIGKVSILGKGTLKFWVTDGDATISAVGFGMSEYKDLVEKATAVDIAYQVGIDDWNKAPTVQLLLKDIKVSGQEASL